MTTHTPSDLPRPGRALPFLLAYLLVPLAAVTALEGGWWVAILPIAAWFGFALRGAVSARDHGIPEAAGANPPDLVARRAAIATWAPVQFLLLYWLLWYVPQAEHLSALERLLILAATGVVTGTVGFSVSHELMHRKDAPDLWLADVLLAMVLQSHLRSEHLLVHHRHVGTPRDPGTARYGESFYRFLPRAVKEGLLSAIHAEIDRRGQGAAEEPGPFWRYAFLQLVMLMLAAAVGGGAGLGLFLLQAGVAIICLHVGHYIDHYGLTRRNLDGGGYEPVLPHHGWAERGATGRLPRAPQRLSERLDPPARRLPLLRPGSETEPAALPHPYPVMALAALVPSWWRRLMRPRVRQWRQVYHPDISDWRRFNAAKASPPE